MPNRTIYIADADLAIYDEAQRLAGDNLSATIVKALKQYIETQTLAQHDLQEITIWVGRQSLTPKRFVGQMLARGRYSGSRTGWSEILEVYLTRKGAIALHRRTLADTVAAWGETGEQWTAWRAANLCQNRNVRAPRACIKR